MIKKLFIVMVGLLVLPMIANATILDLRGTPSQSGFINGIYFYTPGTVTSGTGLIDPFVRIQASAVNESGYNTGGTLEFDTKSGKWTHPLQIYDLRYNKITIDVGEGLKEYYEMVLDVNESTGNSEITIHELEFYIDPNPNNTGYPALGTLVYDLDAAPDGDSEVRLDYKNYKGSGKLDLIFLIPTSVFGSDTSKYIYLYSQFGQPDNKVDDGFEEYAHAFTGTFTGGDPGGEPVPEPGTLLLLGSGLAGLAGYAKLRFRRKRE